MGSRQVAGGPKETGRKRRRAVRSRKDKRCTGRPAAGGSGARFAAKSRWRTSTAASDPALTVSGPGPVPSSG